MRDRKSFFASSLKTTGESPVAPDYIFCVSEKPTPALQAKEQQEIGSNEQGILRSFAKRIRLGAGCRKKLEELGVWIGVAYSSHCSCLV